MQIKKEYKMYAGHRNQDLNDKCFHPHGHDYRIFCYFAVSRKGSISTLFNDFDSKIEPMLKDEFDHRFLTDANDPLLPYLRHYETEQKKDLGLKILPFPTSVENVCYFLFNEITTRFGFELNRIEIQETRTSTVIYTKGDYRKDKVCFQQSKPSKLGDYQSLYEFLGHAAGSELGAKVAGEAITKGVPMSTQSISNSTYEGEVLIYPISFLQNYFNK